MTAAFCLNALLATAAMPRARESSAWQCLTNCWRLFEGALRP